MSKYLKPTINTKFHIDFAWWNNNNKNLRAYLQGHSCEGFNAYNVGYEEDAIFDWIDPETGQISQITVLWHRVQEHCIKQDGFIDEYTPLTVAIFRAFIINNNVSLTPVELYGIVKKQSPEIILKTIGGRYVHNGVRPVRYQ
jgi:hypothetical protein